MEGTQATFVAWQQADQVFLRHRVVGIPDQLPLRRIEGTDLWYVVVEIPRGLAGGVPARDAAR